MYEVTTLLALRMEEGQERRNVGSLHKLEEAKTNKQTTKQKTQNRFSNAASRKEGALPILA